MRIRGIQCAACTSNKTRLSADSRYMNCGRDARTSFGCAPKLALGGVSLARPLAQCSVCSSHQPRQMPQHAGSSNWDKTARATRPLTEQCHGENRMGRSGTRKNQNATVLQFNKNNLDDNLHFEASDTRTAIQMLEHPNFISICDRFSQEVETSRIEHRTLILRQPSHQIDKLP